MSGNINKYKVYFPVILDNIQIKFKYHSNQLYNDDYWEIHKIIIIPKN